MSEPRIEMIPTKKLVGKRTTMCLAENKTIDLWRSFQPRRNEILHRVSDELISLQNYSSRVVSEFFRPDFTFEKWAAAEVSSFNDLPEGYEKLEIPAGNYAVFIHHGDASKAEQTFRYIFEKWLPESGFELDDRPHFEILGAKYKNNDPESEEEVWIPGTIS